MSTAKDKRLNATASLLEVSTAIKSNANLIKSAIVHIDNGNTRQARRILSHLGEFQDVAHATVRDQITKVNNEQTYTLSYAAQAVEVAGRREHQETFGSFSTEKTDLMVVKAFTSANKENFNSGYKKKRKSVGGNNMTTKKQCMSSDKTPVANTRYQGPPTKPATMLDIRTPDPPQNGKEYTPYEAAVILVGIQVPATRKMLRNYWIQNHLVPVGHSTLKMCYTKYSRGKPLPSYWNQRGRPRFATVAEVKAMGSQLQGDHQNGKAINPKQWRDALVEKQKFDAVLRGVDPNTVKVNMPSLKTAKRYLYLHRLLAPDKECAVEKAISKSETRRIAESSSIVLLPSASPNTSPNSTTPTSDSTDNNGWRKSIEEIARNTVTVGQPSFEQFEFVITGEWIKKSRRLCEYPKSV